jgi:hypothetical protein
MFRKEWLSLFEFPEEGFAQENGGHAPKQNAAPKRQKARTRLFHRSDVDSMGIYGKKNAYSEKKESSYEIIPLHTVTSLIVMSASTLWKAGGLSSQDHGARRKAARRLLTLLQYYALS